MLSIVFKNPDLAAKRLGCSKSSIYSWLNGHTPNLSIMLKIHDTYKINVTLDYLSNFFSIIKYLITLDDLEDILEYIKISGLSKEDKLYLQDYFKNKYWKTNG